MDQVNAKLIKELRERQEEILLNLVKRPEKTLEGYFAQVARYDELTSTITKILAAHSGADDEPEA